MNVAQLALSLRRTQSEIWEALDEAPSENGGLEVLSSEQEDTVRAELTLNGLSKDTPWVLEPGDEVRRVEIHNAYGGSRQNGIVTFTSIPDIVVFTSVKGGAKFGYANYEGLQPNGTYSYTGEGQSGDQVFQRGNKALRDANQLGRPIHVCAVANGTATYVGKFATGNPTYWIRQIPDRHGMTRQGIIFNLEPVDASEDLLTETRSELNGVEEVVWTPPDATDFVVEGSLRHARLTRTVTRLEFELQRDFGELMHSRGYRVRRLLLESEGVVIEPDLYIPEVGWIVEAKRSTAREYVRTAIGQVLDYLYVARSRGVHGVPVILLPGWPRRSLLNLAQSLGIVVIVRDLKSQGFHWLVSRTGSEVPIPQADQALPRRIV